ncbi:histidine ammonia-lyase, partial [Tritonibacter sp. SIMBA_163]
TANLSVILGGEMLCAAQGVEARAPLKTSHRLQDLLAMLRSESPSLGDDRSLAPEIEGASGMVRAGRVGDAAGVEVAV